MRRIPRFIFGGTNRLRLLNQREAVDTVPKINPMSINARVQGKFIGTEDGARISFADARRILYGKETSGWVWVSDGWWEQINGQPKGCGIFKWEWITPESLLVGCTLFQKADIAAARQMIPRLTFIGRVKAFMDRLLLP